MKIYVVEDEVPMRSELMVLLKKYGYTCESSDDFEHITDSIIKAEPALVLVDINLPFQDGFVICREIRRRSDVPIIVLTSRNTDFDELLSLNIGADDFISKPYNAQVLLARIQRILKRTYDVAPGFSSSRSESRNQACTIFHKGLTVNLFKATMSCNDMEVELTKNELGILRLLVLNKGNVIPRDAIIDELWQSEEFIDENTLNVNIVRLRKKLAEIGLEDYLETKRGLGYRV